MDINQPLHENIFYHVYNRGNNGDNVFYEQKNYKYFLKNYDQYLSDYVQTYAYCLLPNHFHLLVRVKPYNSFPDATKVKKQPEMLVGEQFRRLFISYAQAINKQESRTGSLFQKNFKRKEVSNPSYFSHLVYYIHANPENHGICGDFRLYEHSSYGRILADRPNKLISQEVLDWFGGKEQYADFHKKKNLIRGNEEWIMEDD